MNTPLQLIKRSLLLMALALLCTFCGAKKALPKEETKVGIEEDLSAKKVIQNHYANQLRFKTLSGRMRITYNDGLSSQSYTMSFRMEKDKIIWLSAPLNMAKMIITPSRVSFYNKLDNTYFDGDFSYLTGLLGAELNFEKVQNLLLGQAIFHLEEEPYGAVTVNEVYQLIPKNDTESLKKRFLVSPSHYKIQMQQLSQPQEKRSLNIRYNQYQTVENQLVPEAIFISALQGEHKTDVELSYKNIEFNQELSFPYNIPEGYKAITLK